MSFLQYFEIRSDWLAYRQRLRLLLMKIRKYTIVLNCLLALMHLKILNYIFEPYMIESNLITRGLIKNKCIFL